jgi:hypothetical protein
MKTPKNPELTPTHERYVAAKKGYKSAKKALKSARKELKASRIEELRAKRRDSSQNLREKIMRSENPLRNTQCYGKLKSQTNKS